MFSFTGPSAAQTPASCNWTPDNGTTFPSLISNSLYQDYTGTAQVSLPAAANIQETHTDNNFACDTNRILPAQLTVRKTLAGSTSITDFDFEITNASLPNFDLAHNETEVLELVPPIQTYNLRELQPSETVLWNIGCTSSLGNLNNLQIGPNGAFDHGDRNVFLAPDPGEIIDCTFLNINSAVQATKDDGQTSYVPGGTSTYTITLRADAAGFDAHGVNFQDVLPAGASLNGAITCAATGTASCSPIDASHPCNPLPSYSDPQVVSLQTCGHIPADGSSTLDFTVPVSWTSSATGQKTNHGFGYSATQQNAATDTDVNGQASVVDLAMKKTAISTNFVPGGQLSFRLEVDNTGISDANASTVLDPLPTGVISGTWACILADSSAGACPVNTTGTGDLNETVNVPAGGKSVFTVTYITDPLLANPITNSASIAAGPNTVDTDPSNNSGPGATATVPVKTVVLGELEIVKSTPQTRVNRLDPVQYKVVVTNRSNRYITNFTIGDIMPGGFHYRDNTAEVQHSALTTAIAVNPAQVGRQLGWSIAPSNPAQLSGLNPGEKITLTYTLMVGGVVPFGQFPNTATIYDSNGVESAVPSTASVEVMGDFFDCGTVIGQVYWDHNRNGNQDAGETGVPGASIYDVRGNKITVDSNGRYHVPCQSIGRFIENGGSNYMLKIDSSTLPLGSSLTTEEARTVRLTPGKMSDISFGIAPSSIEVSLSACNYIGETRRMNSASRQKFPELIEMLDGMQSPNLEIKFTGSVKAADLNRQRLVEFAQKVQSQSSHKRIDITTKLWRLSALTNHDCDPLMPNQVEGAEFASPLTTMPIDSTICPPLPSIFFDTDSANLRLDQIGQLNMAMASIAQSSCRKLLVTGYTDFVGPAEYNSQLSMKRADTVGKAILDQGLALSDLIISSHLDVNWQGHPSAQPDQVLRRVELKLIPQ